MGETRAQELKRRGARASIYYRHRKAGATHEDAIQAAINAPTAAKRIGNCIDHSISSIGDLLRQWKRA